MSLDAYQGDDAIMKLHAERTGKRNGVELGPSSPLRPTQAVTRSTRRTELDTRNDEHTEQCALFQWINDNAAAMPDLAKAFAIPNGGYRNVRTAGRLKAEGVRPGIPDVMLLVARGQYHGLMIEMKRPGGVLSPSQADWHYAFTKDGFKVAIATTWEMARDHILEYLALPKA
jgi:hypothetical protein